MSSSFGRNIRLTVFGQSHSPAIGLVMEGLPAGFKPDLEQLRSFLRRRSPGQNLLSTQRQEADLFEVLAGMADGRLTGAPFAATIPNRDVRSQDYTGLKDSPRPGHADYPAQVKYGGHQDAAGGGHFSGRLTAPLCIAGGLCLQLLSQAGIQVAAHLYSIGDIQDSPFDPLAPALHAVRPGYLSVLDEAAGERMAALIDEARLSQDSVGGVIECAATGLPVGLGSPNYEGLENELARLIFGIPAVRGIEFGTGFAATRLKGSQHNDPYYLDAEGRVRTRTNHHGGILGGLSTGMPLLFRVAIKPTSSIFLPQETVNLPLKQAQTLQLKGRHDPCIVPRAVPCVEAACAVVLYDAYLDALKEKNHAVE